MLTIRYATPLFSPRASCNQMAITNPHLSLLPNDKHDFASIRHLASLPPCDFTPLIPSLLTWLQDVNWPVFRPVAQLLLQHAGSLVEPIPDVLLGDDDPWKMYCLEYVVKEMPTEEKAKLRMEMQRIRDAPTEGEMVEECEMVAGEVLEGLVAGERGESEDRGGCQ